MGLHQGRQSAFLQDANHIRYWYLPAAIAVLSGVLVLFGDAASELLRYDRQAISGGEWWRFASGHFVHLGSQHWLLNVAGLALVWLLVGQQFDVVRWGFIVVLVLVVTNIGFWFIDRNLTWYVGLSGLLHGLLVAGAIPACRTAPVESGILLVAVAGKLVYEQVSGPLPGSEATAGGAVVVNAHLYGAAGGLLSALFFWRSANRHPTI